MAKLNNAFNATEHDTEQKDFSPLPEGDYRLEVIESEVVPTKAGTGTILKLTFSVLEPSDLEGRKIWANLNIENANPQAQEIGQQELARLCRAIGVTEVKDSEELHFKAFAAKVGLGKPSKEKNPDGTPVYAAKTEIKKYYFPDEGAPPPAKAAANDNPSTARSTGNGGSAATRPTAAPAAGAPAKKRPWG